MSQTIIPNNPAFTLLSSGIVPPTVLDRVFTSADMTNGNAFLSSGRDLLVVFNSDTVTHTFTISSAPDVDGRFVNVVYTIGAGVYSFVDITSASIFIQSTNLVLLSASSALIGYLVVLNS